MEPAWDQSEASRSGCAKPLRRRRDGPFYGFALVLVALQFAIPTTAATTDESRQPTPQCYAIVRVWDLYVSCDAKEVRITTGIRVNRFAVAQNASYMAFTVEGATKRISEYVTIGSSDLWIVPLRGDGKTRVTSGVGNLQLAASCGTILGISPGPSDGDRQGVIHDVLTGERLQYGPYKTFRCSSDRKAIAGYVDPDFRLLRAGLPPQRTIASGKSESRREGYDVSPNGRFIAYLLDWNLCVEDNAQAVACVPDMTGWEPLSVSDSGEVLLMVGSGWLTCYLDPAGHLSYKALPGFKAVGDCTPQARWKPGDKALTVIDLKGGRNAQWITPEAAAALGAWRARQASAPVGTHP